MWVLPSLDYFQLSGSINIFGDLNCFTHCPCSVEPSGAGDLQAVAGAVCEVGPPGVSLFESVWDADFEGTSGAGRMLGQIC